MDLEDGIVVFVASVSQNTKIKKDCQSVKWLLEKKNYDYEEIDICRSPLARGFMRKGSGKKTAPQVFVNGEYVGDYEKLMELEEDDKLDEVLSA
eukprot:TRINITY_DN1517_c1_g2_i1.p1 TRINITY_DN1517_c1_g2~~TRINITY_DN1517_c1_g2_i1.p1  ORF type:complete len:103 (-),score=31.43 TRINITY_DN1517_c1_g2_i1:231-512(-)